MFRVGASLTANFQYSSGKVLNLSQLLTRSLGTPKSDASFSQPHDRTMLVKLSMKQSMVKITLLVKVIFTLTHHG